MSEQIEDFEMIWSCCCGDNGNSLSNFMAHLKRKKHTTFQSRSNQE